MIEDDITIVVTEIWVGQGDLVQSGKVIVGLTLPTKIAVTLPNGADAISKKVAVGLTPDQAQAFIELVQREIREARMRSVRPLYQV